MKKNLSLVTSYEAAELLGVHHKTVSRLLRQGILPGVKLANRWLIDKDTLEAFQEGYISKKGRPKGYSPKKEA